jgi:pilus assembly protein Flp/PilA
MRTPLSRTQFIACQSSSLSSVGSGRGSSILRSRPVPSAVVGAPSESGGGAANLRRHTEIASGRVTTFNLKIFEPVLRPAQLMKVRGSLFPKKENRPRREGPDENRPPCPNGTLFKPRTKDADMKTLFTRFAKDESGVTAIEYGLIAALIAVVIITAVSLVGTTLSGTFNNIAAKI